MSSWELLYCGYVRAYNMPARELLCACVSRAGAMSCRLLLPFDGDNHTIAMFLLLFDGPFRSRIVYCDPFNRVFGIEYAIAVAVSDAHSARNTNWHADTLQHAIAVAVDYADGLPAPAYSLVLRIFGLTHFRRVSCTARRLLYLIVSHWGRRRRQFNGWHASDGRPCRKFYCKLLVQRRFPLFHTDRDGRGGVALNDDVGRGGWRRSDGRVHIVVYPRSRRGWGRFVQRRSRWFEWGECGPSRRIGERCALRQRLHWADRG